MLVKGMLVGGTKGTNAEAKRNINETQSMCVCVCVLGGWAGQSEKYVVLR